MENTKITDIRRRLQFTRSLKEDLLRRDFTINAMAYNDADGLVDIFGGMEDLKKELFAVWEMQRQDFRKMLCVY